VFAFCILRSNSNVVLDDEPSSFFARMMARLISNKRADVPGRGSGSKDVPERNLYSMVDAIILLVVWID